MKKIIFIADFFVEQGVNGGAEICNEQLMQMFISDGYEITKINSNHVTNETISLNKNDKFFIVANFMMLKEECKTALSQASYLIYEHDHKYVANNDPSKFINMVAPQSQIINREFYEKI